MPEDHIHDVAQTEQVQWVKDLLDLYFAPWGAAKAARFEAMTGDKPFDAEVVLNLIQDKLASQPPAAPVETWEGSGQWQFAQRLQAYLDDAPLDGRHSDAAGGNAYDLIAEAIEWMRPPPHSSAATEGVVGLEVLRHMADRQRGIGMPPKPMVRPSGSNADEWNVFLEEYTGHGNSFIAVQIAEAIEDAEKRGTLNEPPKMLVDANWLRRKVETDPDMDADVLPELPQGAPQRDPMIAAVASLAAAISLLERTPKAKKAAPSDKMFDQMLDDYRKALANARDALALSRPK